MKILLDENIPVKLKFDFGIDFEVKTVRDMGWLGKKNGELLGLIASCGIDFFVTLDKNLRYQQNLEKFDLKIILLMAHSNKPDALQPFVEKVRIFLEEKNYQKFNEITLE